jgi:hypothetical protein
MLWLWKVACAGLALYGFPSQVLSQQIDLSFNYSIGLKGPETSAPPPPPAPPSGDPAGFISNIVPQVGWEKRRSSEDQSVFSSTYMYLVIINVTQAWRASKICILVHLHIVVHLILSPDERTPGRVVVPRAAIKVL